MESLIELLNHILPRNQCLRYYQEKGLPGRYLPELEFNQLFERKQFIDGPFLDTFGDGNGEPYNPDRQAFGTIVQNKSRLIVYTNV